VRTLTGLGLIALALWLLRAEPLDVVLLLVLAALAAVALVRS